MCKTWHRTISSFIETTPRLSSRLKANWSGAACSFYPVTPTAPILDTESNIGGGGHHNSDHSYRNVLCLKADEREIMIAVDNGNVEIYDRHSLELKSALIGQVGIMGFGFDNFS